MVPSQEMVLWRQNSTAAAAPPPRGTFLVLNLATNTIGLGNSGCFESFSQLDGTPSSASQTMVAGDYPTEHRRRSPRIPGHRRWKDDNSGKREEGSSPAIRNPCPSAQQSSAIEETKNASSGTAPPPAYLVNLLEFFGWTVTRDGDEAVYTSPEGSRYYSMAKAFEKFVGDSSQNKETVRSSSEAFHGGGAAAPLPDVAEINLNARERRKNRDNVDIISVADVTEQAIPQGSSTNQSGGRRGTIEEDDGVSFNLSGETEHPSKKANQMEINDHSAFEREIHSARKCERNFVGSSATPDGSLVTNDVGKSTLFATGEMRAWDKVNHLRGVNEESDSMSMEPSTKRYICVKEQRAALPDRGRGTETGVDPSFQNFSTLATYPLTSSNNEKPQDSTTQDAGIRDEDDLFSKEAPSSKEMDHGTPSNQVDVESRSSKKTERTRRKASKRYLQPRNNLIDAVHARRRNPGNTSGLRGRRRQRSGCGLTARENAEDDAQVGMIPQGRITALSWLIDARILSENDMLVHRVKNNGGDHVRGLATRDGIWCSCCEETMSLLEFDSHAGSDLGQPWYDICLASGKSLMQCQMEAWEKERKLRRVDFHTVEVGLDPSDDSCGVCADGGHLVCCDSCPSTFHQDCLLLKALPEGRWHCPYCTCTFCSVSDEKNEALSLFTCQQCYCKYHWECTRESQIPEKLAESLLFCGEDCKEVDAALFRSLGTVNEIGEGFSCVLLKRLEEHEGVSSDERVLLTMECNRRLSMALLVFNECFMPAVDFRTGVDMISHAVFNCGSNFRRLHYAGFYTMILEKDDEIISAASLRFHGRRLAEMPFMGTRPMYRRQGMCRRLLTAIEQLLSSLRMEKLMIPAAGELLETWIDSFSFEPLDESDQEEIRSLSLVAFPRTFLLKKSIPTPPGAHADDGQPGDLREEEEEEPARGDLQGRALKTTSPPGRSSESYRHRGCSEFIPREPTSSQNAPPLHGGGAGARAVPRRKEGGGGAVHVAGGPLGAGGGFAR